MVKVSQTIRAQFTINFEFTRCRTSRAKALKKELLSQKPFNGTKRLFFCFLKVVVKNGSIELGLE